MRILLADPPHIVDRLEANYPNLGLLYLAAYAREELDDLEPAYRPAGEDLDDLLKAIAAFKPDLLGLSFTTFGRTNAYQTIEAVKSRWPRLPVVCGGAHPTVAPGEVLEKTPADFCVIGEGEVTFTDLIRCLRGELSREEVAGLAWRDNGRVATAPPRRPLPDLDRIPFPAWDLIDHSAYLGPQIKLNSPVTALVASRGCPYRCTFCSNPVWKAAKPYYRHRSPANLVEEIKFLYDQGYRELYIRSDEMNAVPDWTLAVLRDIADLGLADLALQLNLRADKIDDDLARALAEAGCWLVHLGIESGNDRVLEGIGKGITTAQVERTCRLLTGRGIKVFGFLMMFQVWEAEGQLEYESPAEVDQTIRFVRRLIKHRWLDYMSWQMATPIPGAQMYDALVSHGLIDPGMRLRNMWEAHFEIPGLDRRAFKRARRRGMVLQSYLYLKSGRIQWRHWRRILAKLGKIIGLG